MIFINQQILLSLSTSWVTSLGMSWNHIRGAWKNFASKFVTYAIPFTSYVRKGDGLKIQSHALRVFDDMTKWCQARWVHIHGLYDLFRVYFHYHGLDSEFLGIFNINLTKFNQINVKEGSFHFPPNLKKNRKITLLF